MNWLIHKSIVLGVMNGQLAKPTDKPEQQCSGLVWYVALKYTCGYISSPLAVSYLSCVVQGPKFKILLPTSFVPRPIEVLPPPSMWQTSSTSSQRSRSRGVLKWMSTPPGWAFDQFYKSPWQRWLKLWRNEIMNVCDISGGSLSTDEWMNELHCTGCWIDWRSNWTSWRTSHYG